MFYNVLKKCEAIAPLNLTKADYGQMPQRASLHFMIRQMPYYICNNSLRHHWGNYCAEFADSFFYSHLLTQDHIFPSNIKLSACVGNTSANANTFLRNNLKRLSTGISVDEVSLLGSTTFIFSLLDNSEVLTAFARVLRLVTSDHMQTQETKLLHERPFPESRWSSFNLFLFSPD